MRYATFALRDTPHQPHLGLAVGEAMVDLAAARTWAQGARGLPAESLPDSLFELLLAGPKAWDYARRVAEALRGEDLLRLKGAHRSPVCFPLEQVLLYPPLPRAMSLRDFYAFEAHVAAAHAIRGREISEAWYQMPIFYYSNAHNLVGHDETVPHPAYSEALDYELEVACLIGRAGRDLSSERAVEHIFGYTILNDWSARDVQRREMSVGLGPAKGKDFATSLGPWIVTPDELAERATDRLGVYDLEMVARVNGEERSRGNWKDIHYTFGEMIARASQEVFVLPGDVIGSGTVGTGCLLELTRGEGPWLKPGDAVELEVEKLGVLRNRIGEKKPTEP